MNKEALRPLLNLLFYFNGNLEKIAANSLMLQPCQQSKGNAHIEI